MDKYRFSLLSARTRRSCSAQQCAARAAIRTKPRRTSHPGQPRALQAQSVEFRSRLGATVRAWFPAGARRHAQPPDTAPLYKSKLFIGRSCPILVLIIVLGRPRGADVKNELKNYQGPTTSRENSIRKYLNLPHMSFLNFSAITT
jgi:hypothetical protein